MTQIDLINRKLNMKYLPNEKVGKVTKPVGLMTTFLFIQ